MTTATIAPRVEVVMGTTKSGNSCLRASTDDGTALAAAILVDGRWHIAGYPGYLSGPPVADLIARNESDARAWVRWISEQMARELGGR